MGDTCPGPEQTQIVINLSYRTNCGTRIFGSGFLVDGNGGGQTINGVNIRLVHLPQKLPGIRAKTLHIPTLSFGINGIKSQAGFAGAGQTGEHHQFISGDGQVYVFQVVFSGTFDANGVIHSHTCFLLVIQYIIPQFYRRYKMEFKQNFAFCQ